MYLTRMQLDIKKRDTMKAFSAPDMFHGAVESAFKGERKRRLWRLDCLNGIWYLMIVSEDRPDLMKAAGQFGISGNGNAWETKDYTNLLGRIKSGDYWHFRLIANPTVSRAADGGKRGKVFAHLTPEQQMNWLRQRGPSNGFSLEDTDFNVTHEEWYVFRKKPDDKRNVSILAVTYEGVLQVTDSDLFCHTLCEGVGRGKAYGMGLLTVAGQFTKEEAVHYE